MSYQKNFAAKLVGTISKNMMPTPQCGSYVLWRQKEMLHCKNKSRKWSETVSAIHVMLFAMIDNAPIICGSMRTLTVAKYPQCGGSVPGRCTIWT